MVFYKSQNLKENILFYCKFWFLIFLEIEHEGLNDKGCEDLILKVYQETKEI